MTWNGRFDLETGVNDKMHMIPRTNRSVWLKRTDIHPFQAFYIFVDTWAFLMNLDNYISLIHENLLGN